MAGFSIILLMLVFWPVLLVLSLGVMLAVAAAEFVMSPAFPCLLASMAFGIAALVDLVRLLWRRHKEESPEPFRIGMLSRPALLALVSFALFVVMCVISANMVMAWYQEVADSARARSAAEFVSVAPAIFS